jgi:hypothetical protein
MKPVTPGKGLRSATYHKVRISRKKSRIDLTSGMTRLLLIFLGPRKKLNVRARGEGVSIEHCEHLKKQILNSKLTFKKKISNLFCRVDKIHRPKNTTDDDASHEPGVTCSGGSNSNSASNNNSM